MPNKKERTTNRKMRELPNEKEREFKRKREGRQTKKRELPNKLNKVG